MKTIKLTPENVNFSIKAEHEYMPVEHALSFKETGADHSEYIAKVQENDGENIWLWCFVTVTAEFNGLIGTATLGACAYQSEADFKIGGYYEQMQIEAIEEIQSQLDKITKVIESANPTLLQRIKTAFSRLTIQEFAINTILWVYPLAVIAARAYVTLQNR